jgi:hypothetical protein
MDIGERIRNESDPILREIWGCLYTKFIFDPIEDEYLLINESNKYVKKIKRHDFYNVIQKLKFKTVITMNGENHTFVSTENNGLNLLMDMIKPSVNHIN